MILVAISTKGTWHIYEMETRDEDYFNMEVQAYIKINPGGSGQFQFGLVSGQIHGEIDKYGSDKRFEFTRDGNDECDPASGIGWLKLRDENSMEGKITALWKSKKYWKPSRPKMGPTGASTWMQQ